MSDVTEKAWNSWDVIYINDENLVSVLCHVPLHIFSVSFISIVWISIMRNQHMQPRPKALFLLNCGMFWITAVYTFLSDVVFFAIWRKSIFIQTCSVLRNFVENPLALQTLPDAVDKYLVLSETYTFSVRSLVIFNMICLLLGISLSAYNTFIQDAYTAYFDSVCPVIRSNKWIPYTLFEVSGLCLLVSGVLYLIIYIKFRKLTDWGKYKTQNGQKTKQYYSRRNFLRFLLTATVLTVVCILLPLTVTMLSSNFEIVIPKFLPICAWVVSETGIPMYWLLQVLYLSYLRKGFIELFRSPTPNNQNIIIDVLTS